MFVVRVVCVLLVYYLICCFFFFFKQKTAYEMRISDWSSDVCSSDLAQWIAGVHEAAGAIDTDHLGAMVGEHHAAEWAGSDAGKFDDPDALQRDRKSVV